MSETTEFCTRCLKPVDRCGNCNDTKTLSIKCCDSVTISRECAKYAAVAIEDLTKDKVFTAEQAGKVSWFKSELKQALQTEELN